MGSGRREKPVVFILMNKQNLKTMEDIGTNLEGTIQLTTGHARFKTDEALEKSLFWWRSVERVIRVFSVGTCTCTCTCPCSAIVTRGSQPLKQHKLPGRRKGSPCSNIARQDRTGQDNNNYHPFLYSIQTPSLLHNYSILQTPYSILRIDKTNHLTSTLTTPYLFLFPSHSLIIVFLADPIVTLCES
jgi:hypothetical protein